MKKYKKVYLEITNVCNLKCDFCPETKRKAEFMTPAGFAHILEEIKPFTDYIYLHVKGEPFLHPELERLLDISSEKGFKVNITTNGTLIHKVGEVLLRKSALRQINFSLHSFDGNQKELSKDKYVDDILDFSMRAMEESNIIISLRLWNLNEALATEDQRKRNAEILHKIEEKYTLPYKIQGNLAQSKALKISNQLYLNQDYEFKWPDLKEEEDLGKGTCYGLRHQIAILADGTVVPCCLDGEGTIPLGNIHEKKFAAIITSERAEKIRSGFCNHKLVEELCRKCGYRKRFL